MQFIAKILILSDYFYAIHIQLKKIAIKGFHANVIRAFVAKIKVEH